MFSTIHRFIPFFGRGHRASQSNNQIQQAALTVEKDESDLSEAWLTVSRSGVDDYKQGNRVGAPSLSSGGGGKRQSQRIINEAILQLPFRPYRDEFVVEEDISNGRERYKIPALSYKRHDHAPSDYHYVTEHVQCEPVQVDGSLAKMSSCDCVGDCSDGKCDCSSTHKTGRSYDSKGRLCSSYNVDSPEVIYECNVGCRCNRKACKNMVIQGGCKYKLVLFRTRSRGWGIRTLEDLKQGSYIGVYSGELISATNSYQRQDDTYLFNLASSQIYYPQVQAAANNQSTDQVRDMEQEEEKEGAVSGYENLDGVFDANAIDEAQASQSQQVMVEQQLVQPTKDTQFVCDAKFYGNFTRFINHSCEPNVIGVRSFTKHHDNRFPYISFFTNKEVPANTELTLNYGDNYWLVKCKRDGVYCLCKRPNCRFTKKTFPQTLKQHNKQKQQMQNNQ